LFRESVCAKRADENRRRSKRKARNLVTTPPLLGSRVCVGAIFTGTIVALNGVEFNVRVVGRRPG